MITAIISQNGNAYEAGFVDSFWKTVRAYQRQPDAENEAAVRQFLTLDATRWQYLTGVADETLVDPESWHHDYALISRPGNDEVQLKLFRDYARQAFEDTLTLYLHGTCCDIDVETGPRQMPSRYLRRRLELLISLFPPPEGYAVLPEQLKSR